MVTFQCLTLIMSSQENWPKSIYCTGKLFFIYIWSCCPKFVKDLFWQRNWLNRGWGGVAKKENSRECDQKVIIRTLDLILANILSMTFLQPCLLTVSWPICVRHDFYLRVMYVCKQLPLTVYRNYYNSLNISGCSVWKKVTFKLLYNSDAYQFFLFGTAFWNSARLH